MNCMLDRHLWWYQNTGQYPALHKTVNLVSDEVYWQASTRDAYHTVHYFIRHKISQLILTLNILCIPLVFEASTYILETGFRGIPRIFSEKFNNAETPFLTSGTTGPCDTPLINS